MSALEDLYQSVIIEHDRSPRNLRLLEEPSHHAEGTNPLCGDRVSVQLRVADDDRIMDIAFQGSGCAISRASASLMTMAVKGKTIAEAQELFERFRALMTGEAVDPDVLGKLVVFQGVAEFPMRVKCATLAWHAMKAAVASHATGP
jgi:nitrogen fixation protein NifU and related proteins